MIPGTSIEAAIFCWTRLGDIPFAVKGKKKPSANFSQKWGMIFTIPYPIRLKNSAKIEEYIKDKPEFLRYITNPSVAPNGLKMIFRSNCMANLLLWYLMGATEGLREEPINMGEITNMLANW